VAPFNHTGFADNQNNPGFLSPYKADNFVASQDYGFQCSNYKNNTFTNLSVPIIIQRAVTQNSNATWMYMVTKSGSSNSVNPLP